MNYYSTEIMFKYIIQTCELRKINDISILVPKSFYVNLWLKNPIYSAKHKTIFIKELIISREIDNTNLKTNFPSSHYYIHII